MVARRARRGFAAAFGGGGRRAAPQPVTVRQVNFWLPHERDGDKCLVLLSRDASALVTARDRDGGGGVLTACQLPRTAANARARGRRPARASPRTATSTSRTRGLGWSSASCPGSTCSP